MKDLRAYILALALLAVVVLAALAIGTSGVGFEALLAQDSLLLAIRLPRVFLGALAGGGLAVAGVALQALLRNPLADPYVAGVSGGAALGGVLAIALDVTGPFAVPLWAFAGAVASTLLLVALARAYERTDPLTLLLAGTVFNAFAAALVTFCKTLVSAGKAQELLFWLLGSIGTERWTTLVALGVYIGMGVSTLAVAAGALNLLSLGDDDAAAQGLPVEGARIVIFLASALIVGAVVAVAGMVGFVGLVVPHVLRSWLSADNRRLVPMAFLGGAAFLVAADAVARLAFYFLGTEVPVGVVTAGTGGPFFLALLLRRRTVAS